jgi:hypothetical protein
MAQLILYVSRGYHGTPDFLVQKFTVTLPQAMKCLFHCVFSHPKLIRNLGLCWMIGLAR